MRAQRKDMCVDLKTGGGRDVIDGGGCGFYGMLFYEAGLICDFLRCLPAAGNGFRVSKSHFPWRETASRFQKVISRGGKRFLDFKKSFPVAGNGFRISKSHFPRRETVFGLQKVISRGGKWDWQLDGFPRREGGHLKDSLACVWVIKNSAAKGQGGVSSRLEGVGARGRPRRRRRSSASSRRGRACAPGG